MYQWIIMVRIYDKGWFAVLSMSEGRLKNKDKEGITPALSKFLLGTTIRLPA